VKRRRIGRLYLKFVSQLKKKEKSISAINNIGECPLYFSRERMVAMLII
jgi:hypothetical protein